jgi:CDGSH-type Zn-finger protein
MSEPISPKQAPYATEVIEGETYYWCSCGQSKKQPFCDGSHKGTEFRPAAFTAEKNEKSLFMRLQKNGWRTILRRQS